MIVSFSSTGSTATPAGQLMPNDDEVNSQNHALTHWPVTAALVVVASWHGGVPHLLTEPPIVSEPTHPDAIREL